MMRHLNNYPPRLILAIVGQKERIKEIDMKEKEIHDKAIRLLEGGIVEVDGHGVKIGKCPIEAFSCDRCEMDSICHMGTEMCAVCTECEYISGQDCYLILTYSG